MNKKDEIYKKVKKALIKISIVIGISILILLFLAVPIIIFFLLKNGVEKGAEDSWAIGVGFYGALLGGLGTIIAFLFTSYQAQKGQELLKEQFYEDKRIGVKPFLDVNISNINNINKSKYLNLNGINSIVRKNVDLAKYKNSELIIEFNNIGLGPAINIELIEINTNNDKVCIDFELFRKNIGSININENKFLLINFNTLLDETKLPKSHFESTEDAKSKLNPLNFDIEFKFRFYDILENKYDKFLKIKILNRYQFQYIHCIELPNGNKAIDCIKNELEFKIIENKYNQNLVRESC